MLVVVLSGGRFPSARGDDDFLDVVTTDIDGLLVFRGDGEGGLGEPEAYFIEAAVEPWAVAAADLTGDGLPEIMSANRFGPHVAIFVNEGKSFRALPLIIPTAERPYDIDAGDLDGDRDLDLAVTCNFNPGVVILLFNDGQGAFPDTERIEPGGETFNSNLRDLDGKNGLDLLVVQNSAGTVSTYLNQGDGSFKKGKTVGAGNDPKAVESGDLDGDGAADVVVANDTAGYITVLTGDGEGGLTLKDSYPAGRQPREIALVDLNLDGKLDIVAAGGRGSDVVARFLGNGDATFLGPVEFPSGPRPNSVAAGDFDRDGKPDVAVANWSLENPPLATLSLLYGDGLGEFPRKRDFVPELGFLKVTAVAVGQLDRPPPPFRRGDASGDGRITITDGIVILRYLFQGGAMACADGGDVDDSGAIDITDATVLLSWLFQGGAALPLPSPEPGSDPTPDNLLCAGSAP